MIVDDGRTDHCGCCGHRRIRGCGGDRCPCLPVWTCRRCGWFQVAHPVYGWQEHNRRAVVRHEDWLCPNREEGDR